MWRGGKIGVIGIIGAISVIILITPNTTSYHRAISINNATKKITKLTIRHTPLGLDKQR